jgi:hypothetical protein
MKGLSNWLSKLLDDLSESLAHRKGLVPLIGVGLVVASMLIGLILPDSYLARSGVFLHLGVIVAVLGLMLGQAL